MNTLTTPANPVAAPIAAAPRRVSVLQVFMLEARMEFLRLLRAPSFAVPTIVFPLMFYLLFGVLFGPAREHPESAAQTLAAFLVLGTMAPGLFALGVTLANDRERGLLELKRALPMPPGVYLAAKVAMAMLFAGLVSLLIMLVGATLASVVLGFAQWATLFVLAVLGVLPFCAVGLVVGVVCKASAAPAVLNLIYLPMSFLSGLWIPLAFLPHVFSQLAPLWPSWHLARLAIAIAVVGAGDARGTAGHVLALAAVAAVCFAFTRHRLSRPR